MSDLISRQAAIELIRTLYPSAPIMRMNRKRWEEKYEPYIEAEKALEKLPSVHPNKDLIHLQKEQSYLQGYEDGRKMIRCKDCIYHNIESKTAMPWCSLLRANTRYNAFCSYAEKKEEEE